MPDWPTWNRAAILVASDHATLRSRFDDLIAVGPGFHRGAGDGRRRRGPRWKQLRIAR
jgi:hypothetical protein